MWTADSTGLFRPSFGGNLIATKPAEGSFLTITENLSFMSESTQPLQNGYIPELPRRLQEEFHAMEAVRELLIGKRMAEVHSEVQQTKDTFQGRLLALQEAHGKQMQEMLTSGRAELAALRGSTQASLEEIAQTLSERDRELKQEQGVVEAALQQGSQQLRATEDRLQECILKCQSEFQRDLQALRTELAAVRESTVSHEQLTQVFRIMADRMRGGLEAPMNTFSINGTDHSRRGTQHTPEEVALIP
jgi:hypothetical protein